MTVAALALVALVIAIILSCTAAVNVGIVSVVLAWIVGVYLAGMTLSEVAGGFPSQLFLTLVGVTLLFTLAKTNGTLDKVAFRAVSACRGSVMVLPIMFFFLAFVFGSLGPGNIAAAALIGPMGMAAAGRVGIPAFLMALMIGNGANASALSPIAPTGIIVNGLMEKIGLAGQQFQTFLAVMLAHAVVGFGGYFVFGGYRLAAGARTQSADDPAVSGVPDGQWADAARAFDTRQWTTVAVIVAVVTAVILLDVNVGMTALGGAVLLVLIRAADESTAWRSMPWSPILMVSGVTVLVALVESTGGMDLFSALLAGASSRDTITAFTALLTGTVSIFSSTSGVVLPAFLPTVPGLVTRLGGGDPLAIAYSMIVGSHLVDVSPLSTAGALVIAAAAPGTDTRQLFRWMLAWGASMAVVAAVGCYLVFGAGA